jgi:hypothetical protein
LLADRSQPSTHLENLPDNFGLLLLDAVLDKLLSAHAGSRGIEVANRRVPSGKHAESAARPSAHAENIATGRRSPIKQKLVKEGARVS